MDQVTLTTDQKQAFDIITQRLADDHGLTALTGYAGTGKTTLIAHLIDDLDKGGEDVYVTAPTHKTLVRNMLPTGYVECCRCSIPTIRSFCSASEKTFELMALPISSGLGVVDHDVLLGDP